MVINFIKELIIAQSISFVPSLWKVLDWIPRIHSISYIVSFFFFYFLQMEWPDIPAFFTVHRR